MTISADKMRTKTERSNEQYAKNARLERIMTSVRRRTTPDAIKQEIIDDILSIVAFAKNKKQAREELTELIDLWVD